MGKQAFTQTSRNVAIAWIRMTMERTTHKSAKAFRARSTNVRHYRCETGFQNRLRQPDYLSSVRNGRKWKTLGFASLPHGRFAFSVRLKISGGPWESKGGQTELNNLNPKLSTVILKGFVAWMCAQLGQSGWVNRPYHASIGSLLTQVVLTFVQVNRRGFARKGLLVGT